MNQAASQPDQEDAPLISFSLMDPETVENPYAYYRRLRSEAPVWQDPKSGHYVIATYALVQEVMKDTARFSNNYVQTDLRPAGMPDKVRAILGKGVPQVPTLLTNDPPDHGRFRVLVNKAFSAKRVRQMEDYILDMVTRLLDDLMARQARDGAVEFIHDFASPLPLYVICDALGVPRTMKDKIKAWSDAISEIRGLLVSEERLLECAELMLEFQTYFREQLEQRRHEPREDMLSDLVHAHVGETAEDGSAFRALNEAELINIVMQLMVAGNETSTNTQAAAIQHLIDHPGQMAFILANPDRMGALVDETLRYESPVQGQFRRCTGETEIAGVTIPKDAMVQVRLASANRDEAMFENPDTFDINRPNAYRHMAFGHGPHHCIGAVLAKAEVRIALAEVLRRTKNLRFAPGKNDFKHHRIFHLRGLKALWIAFDVA